MKLLMEALQSEEVEGRIEAMASLRAIAVNLGPEKTRKELIPYLAGNVCVCVCAQLQYWLAVAVCCISSALDLAHSLPRSLSLHRANGR